MQVFRPQLSHASFMLQDTVATEIMGGGKYMVYLTLMINGFVAINVVQAIVTGPLYDRSPVLSTASPTIFIFF
jgi:hypothetical protein